MAGNWQLRHGQIENTTAPVVLVVLDGIGIGKGDAGDAVHLARTPVLDDIGQRYPTTALRAHGTAVGMPSDADMGNSEVGHNTLGAGRVFDQGAKLVTAAIDSGALFEGDLWEKLVSRCVPSQRTLHFLGLLSDGNVHSHIDQLIALLTQASRCGVSHVRVHILLDGRDVPAQSALTYVDRLEETLASISQQTDRDYRIASGGGRMLVTMDRYEADWRIVERGWRAHVLGDAPQFSSARQAIESARADDPQLSDQFLPAFVVAEEGRPIGPIEDGDAVICFNFRGDRAIEISRAFDEEGFDKFDRHRRPDVLYAGMMQYDGDLGIPSSYLVAPPSIDCTIGEYLARNGCPQLAVSETQKFGHVTYFFNGNRSGQFEPSLEDYVEVPSDRVVFNERPWMKAAEITDAALAAMEQRAYRFVRINYPNGDMVGHTGDLVAAILAVEATDLCLGRLLKGIAKRGGVALVTADHGNADQMYLYDKSGDIRRDTRGEPIACTSHSLNPVSFSIVDAEAKRYQIDASIEAPGLANVTATALQLMGFAPPPNYAQPLIRPRR